MIMQPAFLAFLAMYF